MATAAKWSRGVNRPRPKTRPSPAPAHIPRPATSRLRAARAIGAVHHRPRGGKAAARISPAPSAMARDSSGPPRGRGGVRSSSRSRGARAAALLASEERVVRSAFRGDFLAESAALFTPGARSAFRGDCARRADPLRGRDEAAPRPLVGRRGAEDALGRAVTRKSIGARQGPSCRAPPRRATASPPVRPCRRPSAPARPPPRFSPDASRAGRGPPHPRRQRGQDREHRPDQKAEDEGGAGAQQP